MFAGKCRVKALAFRAELLLSVVPIGGDRVPPLAMAGVLRDALGSVSHGQKCCPC